GAGVAPLGLLLERLHHDGVEVAGEAAGERVRLGAAGAADGLRRDGGAVAAPVYAARDDDARARRRRLADDPLQLPRRERRGVVGAVAREQLVEHDAEAV